jgi:hypothetical protein
VTNDAQLKTSPSLCMEYGTGTKEASLAENLRPHLDRWFISMSLAGRKDLGLLLERNDQAFSAVIDLVPPAFAEEPCV